MKDQDITIKICLYLGWTELRKASLKNFHATNYYETNYYVTGIDPSGRGAHAPKYCEDLNAMHDAEITLFGEDGYGLHQKFRNALSSITGFTDEGPDNNPISHHARYVSATARQRAEAFIKTIEK